MSISVLDIIAIMFFVPIGLLVADRFIRGRRAAAEPDANARVDARGDAVREVSDRYRQAISELKRRALQPRWLGEGRRHSQVGASTDPEASAKDDLTVEPDDAGRTRSRVEDREDHRSGSADRGGVLTHAHLEK
jgi:hypothetical protein